jgi:hypothetical protein
LATNLIISGRDCLGLVVWDFVYAKTHFVEGQHNNSDCGNKRVGFNSNFGDSHSRSGARAMSEKEKRKEKPKRSNRRFVGLSIFLFLVLIVGIIWILSILFPPEPTYCCEWPTNDQIKTQNSINLTLISASETAAISHATATAEAGSTNP